MSEVTRDDVFFAMKKFEEHLKQMSNEDFEMFSIGRPIFSHLLPPRFKLSNYDESVLQRKLIKMEFRIS